MYFLIILWQVQPRQSLSEQQNGKDLSIGVFKYGDKAKIYFATNAKNFHSLTDVSIIKGSSWRSELHQIELLRLENVTSILHFC